MSTKILELSDTELQEMFDHEICCERNIIADMGTPHERKIFQCDKPAEWILVCKWCSRIGFECNVCLMDQMGKPWSQFRCLGCKKLTVGMDSLMRIVGKA